MPAPGDVLSGKYQIERVLGRGGMGVVFAARHLVLGQRVAIKFLLPDAAPNPPETVERFLREARASINLRSENVARVLDVDNLNPATSYIVMEFLDGRDLHQVLQEQHQLGIAVAIEYVLQACEALAEAHGMGIVHRDLKPANLFLTTRADGTPLVKVLDFGISKILASGERDITSTKAIMGSPGYMSPEQIRSSKQVDQRTDVWSIGVILYELLSGVPPFDGDNVATLSAQIVLETPKSLSSLRAQVPEALNRVVQRCLAKDANKRYPNVAELAQALRPFARPSAQAIVERIVRIASSSVAHAPTVSAAHADTSSAHASANAGNDGTAFAPTAVATNAEGWAQTKAGPPQQRALWLVALGALALAVVLVLVFVAGQRNAATSTTTAEAEQPLANVATPAAAPTPTPAPAPQTSASPPPATSLHASSQPTTPTQTAKPRTVKPSAIRGSKCPAGQSLSHGHCCPNGLVWQSDRCDRPLATSLP